MSLCVPPPHLPSPPKEFGICLMFSLSPDADATHSTRLARHPEYGSLARLRSQFRCDSGIRMGTAVLLSLLLLLLLLFLRSAVKLALFARECVSFRGIPGERYRFKRWFHICVLVTTRHFLVNNTVRNSNLFGHFQAEIALQQHRLYRSWFDLHSSQSRVSSITFPPFWNDLNEPF